MRIAQAVFYLAICLIAVPAFPQSTINRDSETASRLDAAADGNHVLRKLGEKGSEAIIAPTPGDSRIGPDDLLDITVFEAPEMNATVRVSASGEISLPLLGAVRAAGRTPRELASVLQELLRQTYMKDPHVAVFVHEWQSRPVSVVGAVKAPGVFQIRGTKSLLEVLSMAGGIADEAGDKALITHGDGFTRSNRVAVSDAPPSQIRDEVVDLRKLLASPDSAANVAIVAGDIVKVPVAGIVYVVGEVKKPGGFMLQNSANISVLQALALAEGLTHTSAVRQARIIRTDPATGARTEIPINLGRIFSGKAPDELLQPKDIVFVPNSAAKSVFYRASEAAVQTAAGVAIYKW